MKDRITRLAPFWTALVSMATYYVALPPLHWKYVVFFAPACWAVMISRAGRFKAPDPRPGGRFKRFLRFPISFFERGEYRQYWLASLCFWLASLVWVSYPHPGTILGWLALSCYLAIYFPLFVFESRALHRAFRVPIWLAAPLAWTSCEAFRNTLMGGFSFAGLSHALYKSPEMIQIAELLGEYGVGATIVLLGSMYGCGLFPERRVESGSEEGKRPEFRPSARLLSLAFILFFINIIWGTAKIRSLDELEAQALGRGARPLRVALLQDGTPFRYPPPVELDRMVSEKYAELAFEATESGSEYDAVIWPEGSFGSLYFDLDFKPNADAIYDAESNIARILPSIARSRRSLARFTQKLGTTAIVGVSTAEVAENDDVRYYNSAVLAPVFNLGTDAEIPDATAKKLENTPTAVLSAEPGSFQRYDKSQLVMFGEYVPFYDYIPESWGIKAICAGMTLSRGRGASAFEIPAKGGTERFIIAPDICFESSIPHYITGQLAELRAAGIDPDALLCISSDGWFLNGAETDLHLATQVFRAIENRRAFLAATHGGFSACIDSAGRIRKSGARKGTEVVSCELYPVKTRPSGLLSIGSGESRRDVCLFDWIRRGGFALLPISVLGWIGMALFGRKRAGRDDSPESEVSAQ